MPVFTLCMLCSASSAPLANGTWTRFWTVTNDQLETAIKKQIPKGTQKSTNWGMNVWCAWCNERKVEEKIVEMSSDQMNSLLSRFVQEATRLYGFPPRFSSQFSSRFCIIGTLGGSS